MYRYTLNIEQIKQHEECFRLLALRLIGKQIEQKNGPEVFCSLFGLTPYVCGVVWYLLRSIVGLDKQV
jgi:hypothetical protein